MARTGASRIEWSSPVVDDEFAEYRDASFLQRLGLARLAPALGEFWPARGPQWDALGRTDRGDVLLVEAKAHVGEICSPPSQASAASREKIALRLEETAAALGVRAGHAPWIEHFYQLGNRLAHLHFLRTAGEPAWLVLANFIGDDDMNGPSDPAEWRSAYQVVWHVMGLRTRHRLSPFVIETFPDARSLT